MRKEEIKLIAKNWAVMLLIMIAALLVCLQLSSLHDDNNPFAVPVYILAVAIVSRFTTSYKYGIIASVIGVLCVNTIFTYPFWEFDMTISGYPLTFTIMMAVSSMISALTTQLKKQEIIKREAEKEKMRANLLRSISHDIRTPLASIQGASSTLLENDGLSEQERRDLLTEIEKDARWLTRITENILSVTKFTGQNVQLNKVDEVVEEIVSSAIVKFRRNDLPIRIVVEKPQDILMAPMDGTLIEQVVLNLLENVVSHAEGADCIKVQIVGQDDKVTVSVSDNGKGISPAKLAHVFDGYGEMQDNKPMSNALGRRNMGLGLSVCQAILYAHEGGISAKNNKEGGATFSFWLPCDIEEENEQYDA